MVLMHLIVWLRNVNEATPNFSIRHQQAAHPWKKEEEEKTTQQTPVVESLENKFLLFERPASFLCFVLLCFINESSKKNNVIL